MRLIRHKTGWRRYCIKK